MVIHLLDERNLIRLDDPVCEYIPAFGVESKRWITIRHVLAHRAGLPSPPPEAMDLELLDDPDRIIQVLGAMPLSSRPGRQLAYHAVTGGFILGEIVRRVTGGSIRDAPRRRDPPPARLPLDALRRSSPPDVPYVAHQLLHRLPGAAARSR